MPDPESLAQLLAEARVALGSARNPVHRQEAEHLVRIATGATDTELLAFPERPVAPELLDHFRALLARRVAGEPLQYLAGEWEFFGRTFRCDRRALIPRPETDLVVELLAESGVHSGSLVDFGSGTGILAITAKLERPGLRVTAVDRSPGAAALTGENARKLGAEIEVLVSDWDSAIRPATAFDVLLSNPPYVPKSDAASLAPEVREFEPQDALFADGDALDAIRAIFRIACARLSPRGIALVEIGAGQADAVQQILVEHPRLELREIRADLAGIPRTVSVRAR